MTNPTGSASFRRKGLLALSAVVLALAALEAAARLYLRYLAPPDRFLTYASIAQLDSRPDVRPRLMPHPYLGFTTTPGYSRGRNRHNALGFRGPELVVPKPRTSLRIACLGGSTTYGIGVEDWQLTYPALLEDSLRAWGVREVEAVNAGVPSYSSYESLINLEFRVAELQPDVLFFYEAVNDVPPRLVWPPSAYLGDNSGYVAAQWSVEKSSFLERSTLARVLMIKLGLILPQTTLQRALGPPPATSYLYSFAVQHQRGTYPSGPFRSVSARTMLDSNPPRYWERNLRFLVAIARARGMRPVLATFAYTTAFPADPFIGSPEYRDAIAEHNAVTRRLATELHVPLVDLAKTMPDERRYFTDGVHFTAEGNGVMAHLIGTALLEHHVVPRGTGATPSASPGRRPPSGY